MGAQMAVAPVDDVEMVDDVEFTPTQAAIDQQDECAICFNPSSQLLEANALTRTACGHVFCLECLGLCYLTRPAATEAVACPLCRVALPTEDLPSSVNVRLKQPSGGSPLGVVLGCGPKSAAVCIVDVAPASIASAAGLRSGQCLLAVDGLSIESLAHAHAQIGKCGQGEVRLGVGDLQAPSVRELAAAAMARAQVATSQAEAQVGNTPWRAFCCCYCTLIPQIWQWLTQASRLSCCLAAFALWSLFLLGLGLDVLSDPITSGLSPNASYTDFLVANLFIHDANDAAPLASPEHRSLGPQLLLACLCLSALLGSTLVWRARARLQRDDPAAWAMVTDDLTPNDAFCFAHRWIGPFCCSFMLVPRMVDALERSGQIAPQRGLRRLCPCRPLQPAPRETAWTVGGWV